MITFLEANRLLSPFTTSRVVIFNVSTFWQLFNMVVTALLLIFPDGKYTCEAFAALVFALGNILLAMKNAQHNITVTIVDTIIIRTIFCSWRTFGSFLISMLVVVCF